MPISNQCVLGERPWTGDFRITLASTDQIGSFEPILRDPGAIKYLQTSLGQSIQVSVGNLDNLNAEILRRAGGAVAGWLNKNEIDQAGLDLELLSKVQVDGAYEAFITGLYLGSYRFDRYKNSDKKNSGTVIHLFSDQPSLVEIQLRQAQIVADAVSLARDWGNEPANVINPESLANRCVKLANENDLRCVVLGEEELNDLGAFGILSVGYGSKTGSRLIILEYLGNPSRTVDKPLVLVGKAITFDTGGYSLKDKTGIVGMKYDKCGGMVVAGVMKAAASLGLEQPVVGIIAAAENMISSDAYRPNDIITMLSGKTVEIISTDAEGRMVLADALTYAQRNYDAKAIIDLATLTGGVVTALGRVRAGLMSNDDALAQELIRSGERVHERLWQLPMDAEYFELIRGTHSDLRNSGGREAHPIMGGIFLRQFIDNGQLWAHLDIAGVASRKDAPGGIGYEKAEGYLAPGATGFGIRILIDYLQSLQDNTSHPT